MAYEDLCGWRYFVLPSTGRWLVQQFSNHGRDANSSSVGGGILSNAKTKATQDNGSHLITGGLFIQVFFFGFFIIVAALFHRRIVNNPTAQANRLDVPWQRYLFVLYGASTFIMIRSIYRIADYAAGPDAGIGKSEVYFYVFDGTLMFFTMVLFSVYHPSEIINKDTLSKGGWVGASGLPLDGRSEESLRMDSRGMGPRSMA
jgi:hypothetical protein